MVDATLVSTTGDTVSMGQIIVTRADDTRLDDYRALNDQRRRREVEGDEFFIAEGYVAIDRLVESDHKIRSVLLTPSRVDRFAHHLSALDAASVPVYVADRQLIAETVGFDLHRGVIAAADRRPPTTIEVLAATSTRVALLEGLNDAENLGAIARAAAAFGFDGIVIDPTCTDPYSRRTVRVSMGEVLTLPVVRAALTDTLATLHHAGFESWAMTPGVDADDLWSRSIPDRVAVVLGAEGPGLDGDTLCATSRRVRISISPTVDSLNVGHAAAITFAALTRPA